MLIDISHALANGQTVFPGDPEFRVTVRDTTKTTGYNLSQVSMPTHLGTHLDAPYHFYDNGRTVDEIELDRFFGEACLLDFAPGGKLPSGALLTREMFEAQSDLFQPGARVLYRTGWDSRYGTPAYFEHYPSLTGDAARWIASQHIGLLGMDTPSPSVEWAESHLALLAPDAPVIIVEGLARLHLLPPRFTFIGLPLKLTGGDGSPIRAAALVP